jgi:VanZ family protein
VRRALRWLPAVLWMGVIFWLSSRTGSELGSMFPWVDTYLYWLDGFNFGHFVAYYILAILFWFALGSPRWPAKLWAILLCAAYGATDEYHQKFVEGRMPDWLDLRNDTIGALLAMLTVSVPPLAGKLNRRLFP